MRANNETFKCYENPSYLKIKIQEKDVLIKIYYEEISGLRFSVEFYFNGKTFRKEFEEISTKEKTYNSEEIDFKELEISQIYKEKIAHCINEILDFLFS